MKNSAEHYWKRRLETMGEVIQALKNGELIFREDLSEDICYKYEDGFICTHDAGLDGFVTEINPTIDIVKYNYYVIEKMPQQIID